MSDSDVTKREADPDKGADRGGTTDEPPTTVVYRDQSEGPSLYLQIIGAVGIALLAVVAAQGFLTAKDVNQTAQNIGALASRLQAESDRSKKLFEEIVILRGQVGEFKNVLQITRGQGGAPGVPPGPADWTGVHVNELAPLLPLLAQYEGDMGEAWIYTDNEDFIESIAKALESLEQDGTEADGEQPQ